MNLVASNFLDLHNYLPFYLSVEYPGMLKFSATKYSMDKHSALLKFSRFGCEQSAEGSAFWLLKLSATKYSANEHSAFLGFSRFRCEQSTKGFALLKKVCEGILCGGNSDSQQYSNDESFLLAAIASFFFF